MMAPLLRFKKIEIDSCISFTGKRKRTLKYPVRSIALVHEVKLPANRTSLSSLPEIFWQ
ncbi:MAG: hypothetical protein NTW16_13850 [Bacteroidetes bacterium]|nr:hypothetical protein [Bacteroidota bacterium]